MNKYVAMLLCVLLLTLAGCQNDHPSTAQSQIPSSTNTQPTTSQSAASQPAALPEGTQLPSVDENYWELLCENCDITFYLGNGGQRFVLFYLLSTLDLEGEVLSVTTDIGGEVAIEIPGAITDEMGFPFNVFLSYQGIEWGSLLDDSVARQVKEKWESVYSQAEPMLPGMYAYPISLPFEDLGVNRENPTDVQQIHALTVRINGHEKTYDPGMLTFEAGGHNVNASYLGGLSQTGGFQIAGYPVSPSEHGSIILPDWTLKAKKNVVLEGIRFVNCDRIEVIDCELTIHTPLGDTFKMRWDAMSPIEVDEGSEITLKLTLADASLANKLIGNTMRYIVLDYESNGENFGAVFQVNCRIDTSAHDIFALKVDGIDMLPYYFEYLYELD